MKISEMFTSIQGEGKFVGIPTTFVRLHGCNLDCDFCDTKYANKGKCHNHTVDEVVRSILDRDNPVRHVCFTGGEPMLQQRDIIDVIKGLMKKKQRMRYTIETNGTIRPTDIWDDVRTQRVFFVVSPKDLVRGAYRYGDYPTTYKFVYDGTNIDAIRDYITRNHIDRDLVWLMPMTVVDKGRERRIVDGCAKACIRNRYKFSPRLQVVYKFK